MKEQRKTSSGVSRWKLPLGLGLAALVLVAAAVVLIPALASAKPDVAVPQAAVHEMSGHAMGAQEMGLQQDLAQVRAVTARFHDVDAAIAAGYELGWVNGSGVRIITGCIFHPTAGAMGYHYFNPELMADLSTDALQPEALIYAPENGTLRLAAVEWVVRGPTSNPPGTPDPPSVLGMQMHILNPAVGLWLMHAWVWKPNPAGMFADWNPDVSCP